MVFKLMYSLALLKTILASWGHPWDQFIRAPGYSHSLSCKTPATCPPSPQQLTSFASEADHGRQPNCPLLQTSYSIPASGLTSIIAGRTCKVYPWSRPAGGGQEETVAFNGYKQRLRQYEIYTDKQQFVWFNDRGVPVAFRTQEKGTPVDFILVRQEGQTADMRGELPQPGKLPPG